MNLKRKSIQHKKDSVKDLRGQSVMINAKNCKSFHFLFSIFVFLSLIDLARSYTFSYKRVSNCVLETNTGCVYWESSLTFEKKLDALCFPEETYLQGRESKIKISELKVGDEVMVYGENGIEFQPIKAWLHRDTEEQFFYNFVEYEINSASKTQDSEPIENGFYISGMHNIAILNNQSKQIQYGFAENLKQGDYLYGHGPYSTSETPRVIKMQKRHQFKGVYAPYLSAGNYFITSSQENQQLILVHCFAHVPTKYHTAFDYMIRLTPFWNTQPTQPSYIHPLSKVLKDLFPSVIEVQTLNQMAQELTQNPKFHLVSSGKTSNYRYATQNSEKDFKEERKALIIIDQVLSMVQSFV